MGIFVYRFPTKIIDWGYKASECVGEGFGGRQLSAGLQQSRESWRISPGIYTICITIYIYIYIYIYMQFESLNMFQRVAKMWWFSMADLHRRDCSNLDHGLDCEVGKLRRVPSDISEDTMQCCFSHSVGRHAILDDFWMFTCWAGCSVSHLADSCSWWQFL